MPYHTNRIYTAIGLITEGYHLVERSGNLEIQEPQAAELLRVQRGLQAGDLAVYLTLETKLQRQANLGYLVTQVDQDANGSGWLVSAEAACRQPGDWANEYLGNIIGNMSESGLQLLGDLGIDAVVTHIHDRTES